MYQVLCMMDKMRIIRKVAMAVFKNKKLLQVRTRKQDKVFYTLGGKIEEGESEIECLKREAMEEVACNLDESSLKFLHEFEDVAHGKDETLVNIKMYVGELIGEPKPTSEVVEIGYFDSKSDKRNLSEIAQRKIFPWLKKNGYIN
ncbi:NUDIX domain-containing protein [Candidatus Daviesbacteria bacterium]|nr:NUDIX domain-containing protein [Candidatus Daviesbacteria bacterium]